MQDFVHPQELRSALLYSWLDWWFGGYGGGFPMPTMGFKSSTCHSQFDTWGETTGNQLRTRPSTFGLPLEGTGEHGPIQLLCAKRECVGNGGSLREVLNWYPGNFSKFAMGHK